MGQPLGQRRDAEQIGHRLAGFLQFDPVLVGIAAFVVFVGEWMADCTPTGGEAAVINRKQQASGFEFQARGEAEG